MISSGSTSKKNRSTALALLGSPTNRPYAPACSSVKNSTGMDQKSSAKHLLTRPKQQSRYKIHTPAHTATPDNPPATASHQDQSQR